VRAQQPTAAAEPGSELTVYLVTIGQGSLVWERFGHNAIWIHDAARRTDVAYNWGLFSFDEPGFIGRFIRGRMMYWMGGFDAGAMINAYREDDRPIWVQELRLTPAQKVSLREFVEWNERPENRQYRYDYFRDNCSTRVRDAIDRVLGGRIKAATDTIGSGTTYRWHTRRLLAADLPMYAGTNLGLGEPTDREISAWEEMYLPMRMRAHLRDIRVPDESGALVPLVVGERVVYRATRPAERDDAPSYLVGFLVVGLVLGGALAALGARGTTRRGRAGFASLGTLWCAVSGMLGAGLLFLWLGTDHVYSYWNENLLQMSPLALGLVVLLPRAALTGRGARAARVLAGVVAGLSLLGFVGQLLPWMYQVNGEIIALALPSNLGLALGAWSATAAATGARAA
jgi:hypothetical protein